MACTVFTGGCNLRCPFCHNASLVIGAPMPDEIPQSELFSYLEKRRKVLDGICLTGGEPLLQDGVEDFLKRVRELGYSIKLDTNGTFPEKLRELTESGLVDYVAMDIKNSPERYAETVGMPGFDYAPIRESISFLLSGSVDYEFRTTVVRELHNAESLVAAARSIQGAKRYYLQKFVDSGELIGCGFSAVSDEEMKEFLELVSPFVQSAALRGV
jgi:pyruvate formate lyase activating enzyme